jgi:Tol biopolymer transport system component
MDLPQPAAELRISPDGTRFVATMTSPTGLSEIWIGELDRGTISPLARGLNDSFSPVWSPDSSRVAFDNRDTGTEDLYIQIASGTRPKEKVLEAKTVDASLKDWSRDGRYLLFEGRPREGAVRSQVWVHDLQARSARALIADDYNAGNPSLSPDGRWLAYDSGESKCMCDPSRTSNASCGFRPPADARRIGSPMGARSCSTASPVASGQFGQLRCRRRRAEWLSASRSGCLR